MELWLVAGHGLEAIQMRLLCPRAAACDQQQAYNSRSWKDGDGRKQGFPHGTASLTYKLVLNQHGSNIAHNRGVAKKTGDDVREPCAKLVARPIFACTRY